MIKQLKDNECLYDFKIVLATFLAISLVASDREVENFDYTSHAKSLSLPRIATTPSITKFRKSVLCYQSNDLRRIMTIRFSFPVMHFPNLEYILHYPIPLPCVFVDVSRIELDSSKGWRCAKYLMLT
jgi:hypothetical protein